LYSIVFVLFQVKNLDFFADKRKKSLQHDVAVFESNTACE